MAFPCGSGVPHCQPDDPTCTAAGAPAGRAASAPSAQARATMDRRILGPSSLIDPNASLTSARERKLRENVCAYDADAMARRSAGIVLHRPGAAGPEVLLVHPGGPFWVKRD